MEDDVVVGGVSLMFMTVPIAGSDMNLDVPLGQMRAAHYDHVPEIRTVIAAHPSRVDDGHMFPFAAGKFLADNLLPY
jgi:hypothetical protein